MSTLFHGGHLLSILIFFPAVGALALLLLRGDDHIFIRRIALIVSVAEFLFSLLLLRGISLNSGEYRLVENAQWISIPPIHYHLGVDGISLFLVILTTFLTPISVFASWSSINHRVKEFFVMLLMLEVGVVGVFLSLDLFLFFLFWEVMLIPMALLIGIWGHERRVYAAAFAILRNEADAEDVAQEAVLKAFKHIRQFRAESRFSTWLIQITVNEARMRRRKAHANIMEPIADRQDEEGNYTPRDFADWREIPSETLERNEVRQKLAEALAELGQIYREVFVLRDMQHLSIEETAKALGISSASVKTRLLRARLMLRDLLAPGLGGAWSMTSKLSFVKGTKPW